MVLRDEELTLLPWRDVEPLPGVRADIVATSNDPEMVRWTTVPHPYTGEHADEFLAAVPEGVERWAYVLDGRYAGSIELRPGGVLGYSTAPWARGKGLTTRALRLVAAHAIAQGLRRLELHIAVDNAASRPRKPASHTTGFSPTRCACAATRTSWPATCSAPQRNRSRTTPPSPRRGGTCSPRGSR